MVSEVGAGTSGLLDDDFVAIFRSDELIQVSLESMFYVQ